MLVVGAGAAGLAAGIFAGETARRVAADPPPHVLLVDGARTIGAKLLISGGGRCNVTHDTVDPTDYNGSQRVIRRVLAAFGARDTVRWFAELGVSLKCEASGKLFPTTDRARTVLDALLRRCAALDVGIATGRRITAVDVLAPDGFVVHHAAGTLRTRRVILATGGRSLPRTGSDGLGWDIVRRLGHDVTPTHPALVPLRLARGMFHGALTGLSHNVELTTVVDGRPIDRRVGSMLWTHFGVSGPVAMDASRHWVIAHAEGRAPRLRCSFLPGTRFEEADAQLVAAARAHPRRTVRRVLAVELPERVAAHLAEAIGIDPGLPIGQLARAARRRLAQALTGFELPVTDARGWDFAEVTAGGVPLDEIDPRTMASRHVPGLYLVGEMLDCDGRIGGYNFQWGWATGFLAGRAAVRSLAAASKADG